MQLSYNQEVTINQIPMRYRFIYDVPNVAVRDNLLKMMTETVFMARQLDGYEIPEKLSSMMDRFFTYINQHIDEPKALQRRSEWVIAYGRILQMEMAHFLARRDFYARQDSTFTHNEVCSAVEAVVTTATNYLYADRGMNPFIRDMIGRHLAEIGTKVEELTAGRDQRIYPLIALRMERIAKYLSPFVESNGKAVDIDGGVYLMMALSEVLETISFHNNSKFRRSH